jgi:hypothetical protein
MGELLQGAILCSVPIIISLMHLAHPSLGAGTFGAVVRCSMLSHNRRRTDSSITPPLPFRQWFQQIQLVKLISHPLHHFS